MRFEGSEGAKRSDVFAVDPTLIVIDEAKNGRHSPVPEAAIAAMKDSIRQVGQQQPITCRRLADKRLEVVAGFTRAKAVLGLHGEDPRWRLNVKVTELNEVDAFLANVAENLHRNELTPIDLGHDILRMERDFGQTREQVAQFFGWSQAKVKRYVSLLSLPPKVQRKVASRDLAVDAALTLAKLDDSEIGEAMAALEAEGTKPNGQAVTRQVRERGASVGRTLRELKAVLKDRDDAVSLAILGFLAGECDEDELREALG